MKIRSGITHVDFNRVFVLVLAVMLLLFSRIVFSQEAKESQGSSSTPVRVSEVEIKTVLNQIELVGTAEPIIESRVASEISGVVESFSVKEGDFVSKGQIMLMLRDQRLKLRLKGAVAEREKIMANIEEAKKELERMEKLKATQSVAEKKYDEAYYLFQTLVQDLEKSIADIELLEYEISQKNIVAPFSGYVAAKYAQPGEWVNMGTHVVDLVDLSIIEVMVDVPERFFVNLSPGNDVSVVLTSISQQPREEKIEAVFPRGDANARTFPVKIALSNPDMKIKGGMEARVLFNVMEEQKSLVIHKDAVVIAGKERFVFVVEDAKVAPVPIVILGYFENSVAVEGKLKPGDKVVVRGNERLRPGQSVRIVES
ncbi:MAG: efflux RND transporter periplasmic adaptor subunit [Desulfobacterales bacterium]